MKTVKINKYLFWDKCGYPYEAHPDERKSMVEDMGLNLDKTDNLYIYFHIIDEHKFFLAKIKYGF